MKVRAEHDSLKSMFFSRHYPNLHITLNCNTWYYYSFALQISNIHVCNYFMHCQIISQCITNRNCTKKQGKKDKVMENTRQCVQQPDGKYYQVGNFIRKWFICFFFQTQRIKILSKLICLKMSNFSLIGKLRYVIGVEKNQFGIF